MYGVIGDTKFHDKNNVPINIKQIIESNRDNKKPIGLKNYETYITDKKVQPFEGFIPKDETEYDNKSKYV